MQILKPVLAFSVAVAASQALAHKVPQSHLSESASAHLARTQAGAIPASLLDGVGGKGALAPVLRTPEPSPKRIPSLNVISHGH